MSSNSITILPVLKILTEGVGIEDWRASSDFQAQMLKLGSLGINWSLLSEEEIKVILSTDVNVLNKFAENNGFDIRLNPFSSSTSYGVASLLHIYLEWIRYAEKATVCGKNNSNYKGICITKGFEVYEHSSLPNPVGKITTKNGDTAYLMRTDENLKGFSLYDKATELAKKISTLPKDYEYVNIVLPEIDYKQEEDISDFIKMTAHVPDYPGMFLTIEQALQQTIVKIDREGVVAKSISMMEISVSGSSGFFHNVKSLRIDGPFMFWIERTGIPVPLFVCKFDEDCWIKEKDEAIIHWLER